MGALTVEALPEYAMEHGACKISETVREGGRQGGREGGREGGWESVWVL